MDQEIPFAGHPVIGTAHYVSKIEAETVFLLCIAFGFKWLSVLELALRPVRENIKGEKGWS